jgi:predicted MFS family arabinose efflux permease
MPGLQILNDRLSEDSRQRTLPWYLSAFSLGTAASFYMTGWFGARFEWPLVFLLAGIAQLACLILVLTTVPSRKPNVLKSSDRHPLDFRPVFTNRIAVAYIWGYTGHTYELFAYRAWIVAFLVFAAAASGTAIGSEAIAGYVAVFSLVGMPASVLGAHLALRHDRQQTVTVVMGVSIIAGCSLGFLGAAPFMLVVLIAGLYSGFIMGDSAALTGGTVAAARDGERGGGAGGRRDVSYSARRTGSPTTCQAPLIAAMRPSARRRSAGSVTRSGWWPRANARWAARISSAEASCDTPSVR